MATSKTYKLVDKVGKSRGTVIATSMTTAHGQFLTARAGKPIPEGWKVVLRGEIQEEKKATLKVGDKVRVRADVKESEYSFGPHVNHSSVGVLTRIHSDGDVEVDFPNHEGWYGVLSEMELVREEVVVKPRPVAAKSATPQKFVVGARIRVTKPGAHERYVVGDEGVLSSYSEHKLWRVNLDRGNFHDDTYTLIYEREMQVIEDKPKPFKPKPGDVIEMLADYFPYCRKGDVALFSGKTFGYNFNNLGNKTVHGDGEWCCQPVPCKLFERKFKKGDWVRINPAIKGSLGHGLAQCVNRETAVGVVLSVDSDGDLDVQFKGYVPSYFAHPKDMIPADKPKEPVTIKFAVGDMVELIAKDRFEFSKGGANTGDKGKVVEVRSDRVGVDLPGHKGWWGAFSELKKIVKAKPGHRGTEGVKTFLKVGDTIRAKTGDGRFFKTGDVGVVIDTNTSYTDRIKVNFSNQPGQSCYNGGQWWIARTECEKIEAPKLVNVVVFTVKQFSPVAEGKPPTFEVEANTEGISYANRDRMRAALATKLGF